MSGTNTNLPDIMRYESAIWAIADDLRAASIKQSDFPAYMMPFFALMMLEGRMRNEVAALERDCGITPKNDPDGFKALFLSKGCGFNAYTVMEGKTLADVCKSGSFEQDFDGYRKAFDEETKKLLGIGRGPKQEKFLNLDGIAASLNGKHLLQQVVVKWSQIDLAGYDNSSITTLEEHIKRKWADMSAATAGEQYTPNDIIALMAEIVGDKVSKPKNAWLHVYDPTCGGANLLFGVADRLRDKNGYRQIATYGSENNDALYALSAIESRFREKSTIKYGNTLLKVPFADTRFDVVVANPPYGTNWSSYRHDIEHDQYGQFPGGLPGTGDGQFLFMQHILWQLDQGAGLAVVVADGSTLFSGDAGGGESNIRKHIFDRDWVEAIIQMPEQEFFNTGITTYLWILNKDKPEDRRDLVALIDGSKGWQKLKKSKGDKRREMTEEHRAAIVKALHDFTPSEICKILPREHFYYNKQQVRLTELDDEGKAVDGPVLIGIPQEIDLGDRKVTDLQNLGADEAKSLLRDLKAFDCHENPMGLVGPDGKRYEFDTESQTIRCDEERLGRGVFSFRIGTQDGRKYIRASIEKEITTDYEIIPHAFNNGANLQMIYDFITEYITKPCTCGVNKVGVELNFNKEFYVPEKLESVDDILAELKALDKQLTEVKI